MSSVLQHFVSLLERFYWTWNPTRKNFFLILAQIPWYLKVFLQHQRMVQHTTKISFYTLPVEFSDVSDALLDLNLDFLDWKSSFDGGGGLVGASSQWWEPSVLDHCYLGDIYYYFFTVFTSHPHNPCYQHGNVFIPFLTFTTFLFHSLVRWLYFLDTITSPVFVWAAGWLKW